MPVSQHRLLYGDVLLLRYNPLGLENRLYLGYRYRLYRDPGLLWRDAYAAVAFTPDLNPTLARVGLTVELKPLSVLLLSARYSFVSWFGSFSNLQSFSSATESHSDTALELGDEAGRSYSTIGGQLELRLQLLGKLGPVVLKNDVRFIYGQLDLRGDHQLSYDPLWDLLVPNHSWIITNDSDLLYLSSVGLIAGLRASVVHALYGEEHFLAGERTENPNSPIVRFGPLLAYVFYDRPAARFNKPTALLLVNWNLRHRFRTGADVSRAVPYLLFGFSCEGDLWARSR